FRTSPCGPGARFRPHLRRGPGARSRSPQRGAGSVSTSPAAMPGAPPRSPRYRPRSPRYRPRSGGGCSAPLPPPRGAGSVPRSPPSRGAVAAAPCAHNAGPGLFPTLPIATVCQRRSHPQLARAPVPLQLFTDGITNKLVACYTDEGMADAVLVRVYGRKTELFVDRETELKNFQVLQAHGCAPDLYCAFQNGLCYEFLPGIALGPDHVRDPRIFRLVAQEMARLHAIHANGSIPKPILWQKLHKYLALVKMDLSPKVSDPSLEVLEQELAWMKETLSQLGSPVVLCHNDLLCKNIIYNEHVRFIDYEYTGYNYQAFDIGNHFNEFAGVKEVDYRLYPGKDTQLQWLRSYLQAYKQLTQQEQGGRGAPVSEKELEALYVQVNKFSLASHFLWACWGLLQAKYSTIDFNFLRYAKLRFKQYFKMKPVVTALQLSK
uniref:ethanolamine kinase n=1 Tax=Nothoprocta perdicaria TaxID=30464 RepID=A0A8C6YYS8_NOTPE